MDTGSVVSVAQESVVDYIEQFGHIEREIIINVTLKGVGIGSTVCTKGVIVTIGYETGTCRIPLVVVPDNYIPSCLLLGMNYLIKVEAVLDFGEGIIFHGDTAYNVSDSFLTTVQGLCMNMTLDVNSLNYCFSEDELLNLQNRSKCIKKLRRLVLNRSGIRKGDKILKDFVRHFKELTIFRLILVKKIAGGRFAAVVGFEQIVHVCVALHRNLAHIGREKLVNEVLRNVWHPKIHMVVGDVCRTCPQCQLVKIDHKVVFPPIWKIEVKRPFELIAIDVLALPRTRSGNVACLVAVDHCSKWVAVRPLRDKSARSITEAFEESILPSFVRVPMKVLSDNGVEFRSNKFEEMLRKYGIEHLYSSPYKPASNGAVERVNRTFIEFLKNLVGRDSDWDRCLPKALLIYNNTKHSSIGMSPSEKLMVESHDSGHVLPIPREEQEKWREGHPGWLPYGLGVKVKRKIITMDKSLGRKMGERYEGPYTVTKVVSGGMAYVIEGHGKVIKAHYSHLRIWADPPPYLSEYFKINDGESVPEELVMNMQEETEEFMEELPQYNVNWSLSRKNELAIDGSKNKATWNIIKQLAINSVPKRHDIGTETVRKVFKDAYTQTDSDCFISSPIETSEHLDWFDVDATDIDDSSFDIIKFEESLRFPDRSYILGAVISEASDDNSNIKETTIDPIGGLGKGMVEPTEDWRGSYDFLDVLHTTGPVVKSIRDELREMGEYEEESIDHSDKIIYERKETGEDSNYLLPKTRSRGSVPDFPNVQGRIIEYERRTGAKRRASTRD